MILQLLTKPPQRHGKEVRRFYVALLSFVSRRCDSLSFTQSLRCSLTPPAEWRMIHFRCTYIDADNQYFKAAPAVGSTGAEILL